MHLEVRQNRLATTAAVDSTLLTVNSVTEPCREIE